MSKLLLLAATFLTCIANAVPIRVVVWDERPPAANKVYPNSIGGQIADYLKTLPNLNIKSVGFSDPDLGLADETITNCDVLIWWSHTKNKLVPDEKAKSIVERIKS